MRNQEFFNRLKLIFVMVLCLIVTIGSANAQWELVKDENGIKVYLRTIPGSEIKEFKWFDINKLPPLMYASTTEVLSNLEHFNFWRNDNE